MDFDTVRMDSIRMSTVAGLSAVAGLSTAVGQSGPTSNDGSNTDPEAMEDKLVNGVIESFLSAIGNYHLDSLASLFAGHANISGSSLREGIWKSYTLTLQDFLANLRATPNPQK